MSTRPQFTPKHFVDFEPYCETIAHADIRMRVLGMETPRYSILQAAVGRLGVQWAQEGSGQLSEGATDRAAFGLYLQLNRRARMLNGMSLDPMTIVVLPPGSEFCFSCDHANSWIAIRVPVELIVRDEVDRGRLLTDISVLRPGDGVAHRFRELVVGYLKALQVTPRLSVANPATLQLENQILGIARQLCLEAPQAHVQTERSMTQLQRRHASVAEAAVAIIEESLDGSMSVAEIAASLGVSERTLLTTFRTRFETTPRKFIQSMRLNEARKQLRQITYPETLVQDIAADCGFWDFGRFAAKYQKLFGELPIQTVTRHSG